MNRTEFDSEFFPALLARYASVMKMVEDDATVADDWFDSLDRVTLDDGRKALRLMMLRDPQPFPTEVLSTFCSLAKTLRFQPSNRSSQAWSNQVPTYKCPDCQDRGSVYVYHPMAYQTITHETFDRRLLRQISVACLCDAARPHTDPRPEGQRRHKPMLKLNRQTMCIVTKSHTDDQVFELVDFIDNHYRARNFHTEFEAFA